MSKQSHGSPFRALRLAVLVTGLVVIAPAAFAGSIGIEFDISQSYVSILGGVINLPPDGNISTKSMRVRVPSDAANQMIDGAAVVKDIRIQMNIDANILGQAHVTGPSIINQQGSAMGSLVLGTGGNGVVAVPMLSLDVRNTINCVGPGCSFIGTFPLLSVSIVTAPLTLDIANLTQNGSASFEQQFDITLGGVSGIFTLIGMEIKRTFVPEAGTVAMLGVGLLVAAAVGRKRQPSS